MQNEAKEFDRPTIRPATREDAVDLAPRLRQEDVLEVLYGSDFTPEEALPYEIAVSEEAYAVVWKGQVIALFGVVNTLNWGDDNQEGFPWMLASKELKDVRKSLLRTCVPYVRRWLQTYTKLSGYAWAENHVHLKWLQWLGFQLDEPKPFGPHMQPFRRFSMKE
jgi:hypothetical protein